MQTMEILKALPLTTMNEKWNPAGKNGQASGQLSDVAVLLSGELIKTVEPISPLTGDGGITYPGTMVGYFGGMPAMKEHSLPLASNGETLDGQS